MSADEGSGSGTGAFSAAAAGGFDFGISAFHDARMRGKWRKWFKRDRAANWAREDSEIERRVRDAKRAGVHPLFALGASVSSSPAYQMGDGGTNFDAGGIGRSLARVASGRQQEDDAMSRETHEAALEESRARARMYNSQADDFTAQALAASGQARMTQNANVQQDLWKVQPDAMTSAQSRDPSVSAGRAHPAFREYIVSKSGLSMDLPYSDEGPGEALENVPFYLWPLLIQHNRAKYGDDWGTRFFQEMVMDRSPKYRDASKPVRFWDRDYWQ